MQVEFTKYITCKARACQKSKNMGRSSTYYGISTRKKKYGKGGMKKYKKKPKSLAIQPHKGILVEKKAYDVLNGSMFPPIGSAFTVNGAVLYAPAQAVTIGGRIGAKTRMKSLQVRAAVSWPGAQTTASPSQCRIVVVYDRQPNGAVATRSDVFTDGTLCTTPYSVPNQDRFITLVDEYTDIPDNGQFAVSWSAYRKLDLDSCASAGNNNPNTGALLMFAAANSLSNESSPSKFPTIEFSSRVRFTDV